MCADVLGQVPRLAVEEVAVEETAEEEVVVVEVAEEEVVVVEVAVAVAVVANCWNIHSSYPFFAFTLCDLLI
jgi:hypothetical protein